VVTSCELSSGFMLVLHIWIRCKRTICSSKASWIWPLVSGSSLFYCNNFVP